MKCVAILQARMESKRLPGKVLMDIAGRTMLARTVERVRRSTLLDTVVLATTTNASADAIAEECTRIGVACFRGSEHDVLDRYHRAAEASGADVIVRITCDCPLIDPEVIDRVLASFLEQRPDYASNFLERTYPRGLDTEAMSRAALQRATKEAREPHEREHVTPYIFEHPALFHLLSVKQEENCSSYRLTVDTEEDLSLARAIYGHLGSDGAFSWRAVIELLRGHPTLADINRDVLQKSHREHERA